jgi:hypothetical protein
VAVVFDPPNEDQTFQKLEVYEVKNGRSSRNMMDSTLPAGR